MSGPVLSVVIPTYRRDDSVARLLGALRAQDLGDVEIIVVDQNPPGYLEGKIAEALRGAVHVRLDEPNASAARNAGFARARGRYVLFVDDDLVPEADLCRRAVETMERHPEIGCLCPLIVTGEGRAAAREAIRAHRRRSHPAEPALWEVRETISAAVFFESLFFRRTGGFDEVLFRYARTAEDQELFLRMRARGQAIWLDSGLSLFHDEGVPGGCELRSSDYWRSRERCTKSWVLRARIHNDHPGSLSASDLVRLGRSSFLNRGLLRISSGDPQRNAQLLAAAIRESRGFLEPYLALYSGVKSVDHLARHLAGKVDEAPAR